MRFLGLERPVEYLGLSIFNPAMAEMLLDAQKDYVNAMYADYQQGVLEMKEFNKQYGDFISPFAKDMDRYNEMMSGVKGMIDDAYANGIDLIRTPQGRLLISKAINSINPAEYNRMRANAEMGFKYLQAVQQAQAKGEFDLDFENFALTRKDGPGLFNDFSSANGALWNRPAPSTFKDVNQWTHHLFDNMDLSYDPEESKKYPGYLAYTKSRDTMNKIVDDNIAQLLNTDLGKYYLQDALNSIPYDFLGDRKDEALRRLKERVVNANWELNRVKLETDPYAIARYSARLSNRGTGGGGGKNTTNPVAYDSAEGLFYRGFIRSGGAEDIQDPESAVGYAMNNIVNRQIGLLKQANALKKTLSQTELYILDNLTVEERPQNFAKYTGVHTAEDGSFTIGGEGAEDPNRFFSGESITSHMYGIRYGTPDGPLPYPGGMKSKQQYKTTNRSNLAGKTGIPTRKVVTAFTRKANGEYAARQFWKVEIGTFETDKMDPSTSKFKSEGYMYYEMPSSRAETHNMPDYRDYKLMSEQDKNWMVIPSIRQNPVTRGWQNTGSQEVNSAEKVPSPMGFWGTYNNEALETE